MGLDKWLNSEKVVKKQTKKPTEVRKKKSERKEGPNLESKMLKLQKYTLNCPNSKCKYQKIVMKKELTDKDKICPRCNKEMKIKAS
ncbi:MAG: hypothetical protein ACFE8B_14145 [Candidatus Hermodarchaeota archaeon]